MNRKALIKQPLMLLNLTGVHPNYQSWIRIILSGACMGFMCLEHVLKCLHEWEGLKSMKNLAVSLGFYQLIFKLTVLASNRNNLSTIMDNLENCWSTRYYSENLKNELKPLHSFAKSYTKLIIMSSVVFIIIFYSKPFLSTERILPFETYHPKSLNKFSSYIIMYVVHTTVIIPGISIMIGFDLLFLVLIITITSELKVLKEKLENITIYTNRRLEEDFNELINHHNLILECTRSLNSTYKIALLNVFLMHMLCISVGLLVIISNGFPPSSEVISSFGFYVFFYASQLFFYCFGGSYLIEQSEEISYSIYKSEWWARTQPQFRRACMLVIQRANKAEKLTAGGIFTLNLENFTRILRTALSFFTFVQAVYG